MSPFSESHCLAISALFGNRDISFGGAVDSSNHHDFFIELFLQTPSLSTNVQHIVGFVQNIPSVATGCEMLGFLASYRLLSWFNWPSFGSSSSTTATSEEEAKLARKVDDQPSRAFEGEKKHLVLGDEEDDEGHIIVHSHKEQSRPSELPIDLTFRLFRQSIYPVAYGWRSDIWKCAVKQDAQSSEVAVKSIRSHDLGAEDIYNKNEQLRPALKLRARLKHENILPLLGVATGFGRFTALVYPWMENGWSSLEMLRPDSVIYIRAPSFTDNSRE
ncbi:hypothetical protein PAXINDRAFT_18073 [Paxillus involutus ATCC 200175]|uniref:Protein kinase domain-containing protein n=1 Tax=Paxillus involutus ATCC 200175 TaxID=664439 RepID=A0A0C9TM00_PAXIN|nr:hypothetical protein PAXINDRAFT_18073 [Paxillus involutus ATCC 200175]